MNAAKQQLSLYAKVVNVTDDYLGPASERFISRQIHQHIGKEPEDLTKADLEKLIDWIKLAIALLSEDSKLVEEFTESLMELVKTPSRQGS